MNAPIASRATTLGRVPIFKPPETAYVRAAASTIHRSTQESAFRFELLLDLLSRLLAVPVEGEIKLPFPLEPRFPDRRSQAQLTAALARINLKKKAVRK